MCGVGVKGHLHMGAGFFGPGGNEFFTEIGCVIDVFFAGKDVHRCFGKSAVNTFRIDRILAFCGGKACPADWVECQVCSEFLRAARIILVIFFGAGEECQ